jgi:hypothetical protein
VLFDVPYQKQKIITANQTDIRTRQFSTKVKVGDIYDKIKTISL